MPTISSNNRRIARNAVFLYIRMVFVLLVSLYTTRVVLKVLGADDYGVFNVVCGFVGMFGFLNTSLSNAMQRFYNFEIGKYGYDSVTKVFSCSVIIQILIMTIIVILLESFGLWYINNKLVIDPARLSAANWLFQFAVVQMVFTIMSVPFSAAIMAYEKMDYFALVSIVDVLLKLGVVIVLQYVDYDKLIFYGFLLIIMSVLNFMMYFIYSKIKFKEIKFCKNIHKDDISAILSFTGWNLFGSFAYMLKNQGSAILLNSFFGTVINAAFGISNQVMGALKNFSINLITAFRPQLVESYARGDIDRTTKMFFSMTKISYIFLFTISLPLICEIKQVLLLWLGKFPDYTLSLTILAMICMLISNLNTPVVQMILAVGKLKEFEIITSMLICAIIPFSWLAFRYGLNPNWIYLVSIIIVIVNQIANLIVLRSLYDYSYTKYIKEAIIPCVVITILSPILPLVIIYFMPSSIIRLLLVCFVSIFDSAFVTYSFCLNNSEKQMLKAWINNKIKTY